jgi:hypothetical protein
VIAGRYVAPVSAGGASQGLSHRQPSGNRQPARADRRQRVRLLYRQLWWAGIQPSQRRRASRRYAAGRLGSRAGRHSRLARRRQERRPPAGQHHRPPVVGIRSQPRTLNDAWITNGMARYGELMYLEDESGRSAMQPPAGRRRRRSRLRHHSPLQRRPPQPLLARVPVHDPRKGRHGLPHAALGMGDKAFPGHTQRCAQPIHRQLHPHPGLHQSQPNPRASSS